MRKSSGCRKSTLRAVSLCSIEREGNHVVYRPPLAEVGQLHAVTIRDRIIEVRRRDAWVLIRQPVPEDHPLVCRTAAAMEYLHFVTLPSSMSRYARVWRAKGLKTPAPNITPYAEENEGVVHGAGFAALEDLGHVAPSRSEEAIRFLENVSPRYSQVRSWYTKARRSGARETIKAFLTSP